MSFGFNDLNWFDEFTLGVLRCRNRNRDGTTNQKIKFEKIKSFGVVVIVYFGKLKKNQKKDKTRYAKNQILGQGVGYAKGRY